MKILILILLAIGYSDSKQVYVTLQMMDQVMALDTETLQIDQSISTEFNQTSGCSELDNEDDCNISDECEWMMEMCMENTGDNTMSTPHFIALDEIQKVLNHINDQPKPNEIKLPEAKKISIEGKNTLGEDHDELLSDAAKLIVETGQASVSLLQRRFRIGYNRAGRLIDELEALGIISGYSGSKAREVLVDSHYIDNLFNK